MPNPIAAAVGLAALDTLIDEQLVEHAAAVGAHLLRRLASIDNLIIRAVCGGLSAGVELYRNLADGGGLVRRLLQVGVLTKETHRNTIRLAPPLIINESQIHWAVDRLTELLHRLFRRSIKKKPLARASYPGKRKPFSDKGNASAAIALSTPEISRV